MKLAALTRTEELVLLLVAKTARTIQEMDDLLESSTAMYNFCWTKKKSTISNSVYTLAAIGYIERHSNQVDARCPKYKISAHGLEWLKANKMLRAKLLNGA